MADKKPVSVNWQTLFILIPVIDLWAAYRIEKFRVYFLVFWIGAGIVETFVLWTVMSDKFWVDQGGFFFNDPTGAAVQFAMTVVHAGVSIFFIRTWSRDWNAKLSSVSSEKKDTSEYVRKEDSSIELLKKRYAMGEISKEEFERMKNDLENS